MYTLKSCPFCGETPRIQILPMWKGSHGYSGCYEYVIECENSECRCRVKLDKNDTIYRSAEEALNNAVEAWNRRSDDDE